MDERSGLSGGEYIITTTASNLMNVYKEKDPVSPNGFWGIAYKVNTHKYKQNWIVIT